MLNCSLGNKMAFQKKINAILKIRTLIGVYLSNKLFFYAKQGWKTEGFNLVILVLALVSASHVQRK